MEQNWRLCGRLLGRVRCEMAPLIYTVLLLSLVCNSLLPSRAQPIPYDTPEYRQAEMNGLMSLKAAIVGGADSSVAAITGTWISSNTPCHVQDVACISCAPNPMDATTPSSLPAASGPEACGMQVPGYSGRYYCNFYGVGCAMSKVARIELSNMGLTLQQVPEAIGQLTWLSHVFLQGSTALSGPLPSWPNLVLMALGLAGVPETNYGSLPASWVHFGRLENLVIANMSISGTIPYIGSVSSVSSISLENIHFTDVSASLPEDWGEWHNMQSITLRNVTGLRGGIPSSWASNMSQLKNLTISGVPGIIASLDALSGFSSSIKRLDLSNSNIPGTLPVTWSSAFPYLQVLNLSRNALTGSLVPSWNSLAPSQYTLLDLSYNHLQGPIPDWSSKIGTSSGWPSINLSHNQFICGPIPSWFNASASLIAGTSLGQGCAAAWNQSSLSVLASSPVTVGSSVKIIVTLKDSDGAPVTNLPLSNCQVQITGATYLGCYRDTDVRAMEQLYTDDYVSHSTCMQAAQSKGYKYFGVEWNWCWASNDYNKATGYGTTMDCAIKCPGAGQEMGGGPWAISLFRTGAPSVQEGSSPGYKYIGCYTDAMDPNRVLPDLLASHGSMTVTLCYNMARQGGYQFFGLEAFGCWAGTEGHRAIQYGIGSGCNMECAGNNSQICGGSWSISLYEIAQNRFTDVGISCSSLIPTGTPGSFTINHTVAYEEKLAIYLALDAHIVGQSVLDIHPEPPKLYPSTLQLADQYLDHVIGQDIVLQLSSNTTYSYLNSINGSWQVSIETPAVPAKTVLGTMQQGSRSAGAYWWNFTVPGSTLAQTGNYTFHVDMPATVGILTVFNSPLAITVTPVLFLSAPAPYLGANVSVKLQLRGVVNESAGSGQDCSLKAIQLPPSDTSCLIRIEHTQYWGSLDYPIHLGGIELYARDGRQISQAELSYRASSIYESYQLAYLFDNDPSSMCHTHPYDWEPFVEIYYPCQLGLRNVYVTNRLDSSQYRMNYQIMRFYDYQGRQYAQYQFANSLQYYNVTPGEYPGETISCSAVPVQGDPSTHIYSYKLNQLGPLSFYLYLGQFILGQASVSVGYAPLDNNKVQTATAFFPNPPNVTAGQSVTVQLSSGTSFETLSNSGVSWSVSILSPGSTSPVNLGMMAPIGQYGGLNTWGWTVEGDYLTKAGQHQVIVGPPGTSTPSINNSTLNLTVLPGLPYVYASVITVSAGSPAYVGSEATINVVLRDAYSNPVSAPDPACHVQLSGLTYLGCYNAYSQGLRDLIADGSVNIATCYRAALGRGYKLFSLQYGQQCWGGNDYVAATRDGLSSDCTVPCYGNSREVCGGGNVGSLYRIGAPSVSEAAAPVSKYLGCYAENLYSRGLPDLLGNDTAMTFDLCHQAASTRGYTLFGMQAGVYCYGGFNYQMATQYGPTSSCDRGCPGSPGLRCGGTYASSLYQIDAAPVNASTERAILCSNLIPSADAGAFSMNITMATWEKLVVFLVASNQASELQTIDVNPLQPIVHDSNLAFLNLSSNPIAGGPIMLELSSNTSHGALTSSGTGWFVYVLAPNSSNATRVGRMLPASESEGLFYWNFTVPSISLKKAGEYLISVVPPDGTNATVQSSPLNVSLAVGSANAAQSLVVMSTVAGPTVGSELQLNVTFQDAYGNVQPNPDLAACSLDFSVMTYLGCYRDAEPRALVAEILPRGSMTLETCLRAALSGGYKYFAMQNGDSCLASNNYTSTVAYGWSPDCNSLCRGDSQMYCGGPLANSVYKIGPSDLQEPPSPVADYKGYMGCYADASSPSNRTLPDLLFDSPLMNATICRALAKERGYSFYGIQQQSQCYGGFDYHQAVTYGPGSSCTMPCYNAPSERCGGYQSTNLYQIAPAPASNTTSFNCSALTSTAEPGVFAANQTLQFPGKTLVSLVINSRAALGQVLAVAPAAPATFNATLSFVNLRASPMVGEDVSLQLITNTSFEAFSNSNTGWDVLLTPPGAGAATRQGRMVPATFSDDFYYWNFTIPGTSLTQVGSYLVEVSPPLGDTNVTVAGSPMNMTLLAAAPDAMRSQCTVTAAHWNIGTPIAINVELIDAYGNTAAMPEDACQVELYGAANGTLQQYNCSELQAAGSAGVYKLNYVPTFDGLLSVFLSLQSIAVGGAVVTIGSYLDYSVYDGGLEFLSLPDKPIVAQAINLRLLSSTSHPAVTNTGSDGWMLSLLGPGLDNSAQLGLMQPGAASANGSYWEFTVSELYLTKAGVYQVYAAAPAGSNATVISSPLNVTLRPGPASVVYSTFQLNATNPVLGANVGIEVDLKDVYNNRVESPGGECVLKVAGGSHVSSVNCSEFAAGPSPGLYTYTFKLDQLGNTWFFFEISHQSTSQQLLSVQYAALDRNSVYDAWLETPDTIGSPGFYGYDPVYDVSNTTMEVTYEPQIVHDAVLNVTRLPGTVQAGHPVTLHLSSNTSHEVLANSGAGWTVALVKTSSSYSTVLGAMNAAGQAGGLFLWNFTVPGSSLIQAGDYEVSVSSPNGSNAVVLGSPAPLHVIAGRADPAMSQCEVVALRNSVGSTVTVNTWLWDSYGNPVLTPDSACNIIFQGNQSSAVACSALSVAVDPGLFLYKYTLSNQGQLSIYLDLYSTAVEGSVIDVGPFVDTMVYDGFIDLGAQPANTEAGQAITLTLSSNTSHTALTNTGTDGWHVLMTRPTGITLGLGLMQPAGEAASVSVWTLTVDGDDLIQAGVYTFLIQPPAGSNVTVLNSPFNITVTPAPAAPAVSTCLVSAPSQVIGSAAGVVVELRDPFNNTLVQPGPGCSVRFSGAPAGAMCSLRIEHTDPATAASTPQLHIGEVQLFSRAGVQLGQAEIQASQSSVLAPDTGPAACFDGNPDSYCAADEYTDAFPSFTVRYKCDTILGQVIVTNRADCCQDRLNGFTMRFFDHTNTTYSESSFTDSQQQYEVIPGALPYQFDSVSCANLSVAMQPGIWAYNYTLNSTGPLYIYLSLGTTDITAATLSVAAAATSALPINDAELKLADAAAVFVAGQPIMLQLNSTTTFTAVEASGTGWGVSMLPPGAGTAVFVGFMQPTVQMGDSYFWNISIPGSSLTQAGQYSFMVAPPGNATSNVYGNPLNATLDAAEVDGLLSSCSLTNKTGVTGTNVSVLLSLSDAYGNVVMDPANGFCQVDVYGAANITVGSVSCSSAIAAATLGMYDISYPLREEGQLTVYLLVKATTVTCGLLDVQAANFTAAHNATLDAGSSTNTTTADNTTLPDAGNSTNTTTADNTTLPDAGNSTNTTTADNTTLPDAGNSTNTTTADNTTLPDAGNSTNTTTADNTTLPDAGNSTNTTTADNTTLPDAGNSTNTTTADNTTVPDAANSTNTTAADNNTLPGFGNSTNTTTANNTLVDAGNGTHPVLSVAYSTASILAPSTVSAGTSFVLSLRLADNLNNTVTQAALGNVSLQCNGTITNLTTHNLSTAVPAPDALDQYTTNFTVTTAETLVCQVVSPNSIIGLPVGFAVVPGPVSPAFSTINVTAPMPTVAGSTVTVTMRLVDSYNNTIAASAAGDTLLQLNGTSSGIFRQNISGAVNSSRGYVINTTVTAAENVTISMIVAGQPVGQPATLLVVPAAVAANTSTVNMTYPSAFVAGSAVTVTMRMADAFNNTVPPASASNASLECAGTLSGVFYHNLSNATQVDSLQGLYTISVPKYVAETLTLRLLSSGEVIGKAVTVPVLPGAVAPSMSLVSIMAPPSMVAGAAVNVSMKLADAYNNSISPAVATNTSIEVNGTTTGTKYCNFTGTVMNGTGWYNANITASTAETVVIRVVASGQLIGQFKSVQVVPAAVSANTSTFNMSYPSPLLAGANLTVMMRLADAYNNTVVPTAAGSTNLECVGTSTGSVIYNITNASPAAGSPALYTLNLTATVAENRTVRMYTSGQLIGAPVSVQVLPANVSAKSSTVSFTAPSPLFSGASINITLKLVDAYNNTIVPAMAANTSIEINGSLSGVNRYNVSNAALVANTTGLYSMSLTNPLTETLVMSLVTSGQVIGAPVTVKTVPAAVAPAQSTFNVTSPTQLSAGSSISLMLHLVDAYSNTIPVAAAVDTSVEFNGTVTGLKTIELANATTIGNVSVLNVTAEIAEHVTLRLLCSGQAIGKPVTLQVVPAAVATTYSVVAISAPSPLTAGDNITVTMRLADMYNNTVPPVAAGAVSLQINGALTGVGVRNITNAIAADSSYTQDVTVTAVEAVTVSLVASGQTIGKPVSLQVAPGAVTSTFSSFNVYASTPIIAGGDAVVTMRLADACNNTVPAATATNTSLLVNGSVSGVTQYSISAATGGPTIYSLNVSLAVAEFVVIRLTAFGQTIGKAAELVVEPVPVPVVNVTTAPVVALFNPLVNPRVSFAVSLPQVSAATYGSKLQGDLSGLLAANGQLTSSDWVQSNILSKEPVVANATMWFPAEYTSVASPFEGLSALQYFAFLLAKLPQVAFTSDLYPALKLSGIVITNFTVALPGSDPVNGTVFATASSSASGTSDTGASTEATTTAAAAPVQVVELDVADLAVEVAAPATSSADKQDATPPPVDMSKILDTEPPVIDVAGDVFVEQLQATQYTDSGATAADNIDGANVAVSKQLQLCDWQDWMTGAPASDNKTLASCTIVSAINTSDPTDSGGTVKVYVFTYTAKDAAGNRAARMRRYIVVKSRCPAPEHWCADLGACSFRGLCNKGLSGALSGGSTTASAASGSPAASAAASTTYTPPVDKVPPKLKLLGNGVAAITSSGAAIMMDNVLWNTDWQDPGATAVDAVDGDLSASIQSFGAGAVDTSVPTAPSKKFGYVVEYNVQDLSNNAAPTARRLITVVCPGKETYCIDPDTSKPACTTDGQCGKPAALGGSGGGSSGPTAVKATKPPEPPTISLVVPGDVEVPAGSLFDRCSNDAPMTALCERGATAEDAKDGMLDSQVLVCGNRWKPAGRAKAVPILLACGIPGDKPGTYSITFSVSNSAGLTATVMRQVVIRAVCPVGEQLCPDKVTCSSGGICVVASSSSGSNGKSAASAPAPVINQAPNISLVTTAEFGAFVGIKRMSDYLPCPNGTSPSADSPCEPGATAFDPDGGKAGTNTPLDLTSAIVSCPPDTCLTRGCSPSTLRKHRFTVKGLAGCGVNTAADVGTQFTIQFWIWDSGLPVLNATAVRTIVITNPCPDQNAPNFCSDSSGKSFCSGTPCDAAAKMLPPGKPQPLVQLLPDSSDVYIEYGKTASLNLQPCASGLANSSCGAVAWDMQASSPPTDLTSLMSVTAVPSCNKDSSSCTACSLQAVTGAGECLPGNYSFNYTVTDGNGATASAVRRVVVYQAGRVSASFVLLSSIDNSTVADTAIVNLANSSTADYSAAISSIASKLGAESGILPGNIALTGAHRLEVGPQNYSVQVSADIYMYVPEKLVHADVQAALQRQALANSSAARRLLSARAVQQPDSDAVSQQQFGPDALFQDVDILIGNLRQLSAAAAQSAALEDLEPFIGQDSTFSAALHGMGNRRKLLDNSLGTMLSTIGSALQNNLGASGVSGQQMTPSVDLVAGYLSSIQSSVTKLEQDLASLLTRSSTLGDTVDKAFGDSKAEKESNAVVNVQSAYQALLDDWSLLVSNVSSLAGKSLEKMNQQATAAQDMAALASSTQTAIADATALAQQLTEQYVQQTLQLSAAFGESEMGWECDRTNTLDVAFSVNRTKTSVDTSDSAEGATSGGRRKLYASRGRTGDGEDLWQGYMLPEWEDQELISDADLNSTSVQPERWLGAPGRNRLIAGLMLHTTRKTIPSTGCQGSTFNARFNSKCKRFELDLVANTTLLESYVSSFFAADMNDILPYGVDPVFLGTSSLYQADLRGKEGWFYNTSDTTQVPSSTGTPKGFFHRDLQGYPEGFPILIPNLLSARRALATLQYLMDGNYLDKQSKVLSVEVLTYNANLRVLGYGRISLEWQDSGIIMGFVETQGLAALSGAGGSGVQQTVIMWLMPVWLMSGVFALWSLSEASKHLAKRRGSKTLLQVLLGSGDLSMDLATAAVMLLAAFLLTSYCTNSPALLHPKPVYHVYDAVSTSPARIFLPAKTYSQTPVDVYLAQQAQAGTANSSHVLDNVQPPYEPGDSGRWLLPDADHDFDDLAGLLDGVHSMNKLWSAYTLVQGIVLMLLIFRLLRAWSFQSKLGIITKTMIQAVPALGHLLLVILACVILFSGLVIVGIGDVTSYSSSWPAAFEETIRSVLGLGYMSFSDLLPTEVWRPVPQQLTNVLIWYGRAVLFIFVLSQFFLATLGDVFANLKNQQAGADRSIAADIAKDVKPEARLKLLKLLRTVKNRRQLAGAADTDPQQSTRPSSWSKVSTTVELLQLIETKFPDVTSGDNGSEVLRVLQLFGKHVDLRTLQQLLCSIAADNDAVTAHITVPGLPRRVGTPITYMTKSMRREVMGGRSCDSATKPECDDSAGQLAAVLERLQQVWGPESVDCCTAAVAAGIDVQAAVAAVVSAGQLLLSLGDVVDLEDYNTAAISIQELVDASSRLIPVELDPEARLQHEIVLRHHIYEAISTAATAMERWTLAIAKWISKVDEQTQSSIASHADLAALVSSCVQRVQWMQNPAGGCDSMHSTVSARSSTSCGELEASEAGDLSRTAKFGSVAQLQHSGKLPAASNNQCTNAACDEPADEQLIWPTLPAVHGHKATLPPLSLEEGSATGSEQTAAKPAPAANPVAAAAGTADGEQCTRPPTPCLAGQHTVERSSQSLPANMPGIMSLGFNRGLSPLKGSPVSTYMPSNPGTRPPTGHVVAANALHSAATNNSPPHHPAASGIAGLRAAARLQTDGMVDASAGMSLRSHALFDSPVSFKGATGSFTAERHVTLGELAVQQSAHSASRLDLLSSPLSSPITQSKSFSMVGRSFSSMGGRSKHVRSSSIASELDEQCDDGHPGQQAPAPTDDGRCTALSRAGSTIERALSGVGGVSQMVRSSSVSSQLADLANGIPAHLWPSLEDYEAPRPLSGSTRPLSPTGMGPVSRLHRTSSIADPLEQASNID